MKCPICQSEKHEQVHIPLNQSITSDSDMIDKKISNQICTRCGNIFNESGSRNTVASFYSDSYKLMDQSSEAETKFFSDRINISHSKMMLNILMENVFLPKQGSVIDIGCGKGNFLFEFSKVKPKWKLNGIEISKNALIHARQKLPQADLQEGLFKNDFDKKFNLVIALNVLEHLENPLDFLKDVVSILEDNGNVLLDVPNFKVNPADLFVYDHLIHFTKETLENLLTMSGLKIVKIIESENRVPLFAICTKSTKKEEILNHYSLMKNISNEHIKFNDSMLSIYEKSSTKYEKIGVVGLGLMVWVGIQTTKIQKEKIANFFDENEFLIDKKILGIEVKHLNTLSSHTNLPLVLSLSPCYFDMIINKVSAFNNHISFPKNYNYYKKYF